MQPVARATTPDRGWRIALLACLTLGVSGCATGISRAFWKSDASRPVKIDSETLKRRNDALVKELTASPQSRTSDETVTRVQAVERTAPPFDPATSPIATADTPTIPLSAPPYPIDLATALRLADAENPTIAEARVGILAALAQQQAARALLLPSLNAGGNYHDHTGNLQRSGGKILPVTLQSLYLGGGAGAFVASTVNIPAVSILSPLTDAIFEPLAAHQRVIGAGYNVSATANAVLLDVATRFLDLLAAEAALASRRQSAAEARSLAQAVIAFAETGQGRRADAHRLEAELQLFLADIQRAEEGVAVGSARLSERLNLDPSVRLQILAGPLEAIGLVDTAAPVEELVRAALAQRPEIGATSAQVASSEYLRREEQARPLLPTVWVGFSGGVFGGGSNLIPPGVANFAGRTDFDVTLYWRLLNFGAGNMALIRRRQAEVGQAVANRARVINQIRAEVAAARGEAIAQREVVEIARARVKSAEKGYKEDRERLRDSLALPIEALDSLKLLADARLALVDAITRANRAQFALLVALGTPPPIGTGPAAQPPSGPPPITTPLHSPIVSPGH